MVYEVREVSGLPVLPHSITRPTPATGQMDTGRLNKSHTSIYYVAFPPPLTSSFLTNSTLLLFCPLFALPRHLFMFAAIKARMKFELPGRHC